MKIKKGQCIRSAGTLKTFKVEKVDEDEELVHLVESVEDSDQELERLIVPIDNLKDEASWSNVDEA